MTTQVLLLTATLVAPALLLQNGQQPARDARVRDMSIDELKPLMKARQVVIVDTRGEQEFAVAHVPGALNITRAQVAAKAQELHREKRPIVLYCACAQDAGAFRVAEQLAALDVSNLNVLRGGWDQWIIRGEAIEQ
jgi:rhodanese-related sulfurtransferase